MNTDNLGLVPFDADKSGGLQHFTYANGSYASQNRLAMKAPQQTLINDGDEKTTQQPRLTKPSC